MAGLWFDGIGIPLSGDPLLYRCDELYAMIRRFHPQTLSSYKFGLTGDEDFFAPEDDQLNHMEGKSRAGKPLEVCTCLPVGRESATRLYYQWGYNKESVHKTVNQVWDDLIMADRLGANLLLNIGPMPDGFVHVDNVETLGAVEGRIRAEGFPSAVS